MVPSYLYFYSHSFFILIQCLRVYICKIDIHSSVRKDLPVPFRQEAIYFYAVWGHQKHKNSSLRTLRATKKKCGPLFLSMYLYLMSYTLGTMCYYLHSYKMWGLRSTKCSSKALQNSLYLMKPCCCCFSIFIKTCNYNFPLGFIKNAIS